MPPDPHVFVGVGAVTEHDGRLLLIQRGGVGQFASDGHGSWSVPGGWLDFGETPFQAAERETMEESGVVVEAIESLDWVQCRSRVTKAQIVTLMIRCRYVSGEPTVMEPDKCPTVEWVPDAEVDHRELFAPLRAYRETVACQHCGHVNPTTRIACVKCGGWVRPT